MPLDIDGGKIDICFSGSQKALSAPPGMAPITVNARVEELMRARKTQVASWYFDFTPIMTMWGSERTYHHTPPISLIYGMREALRVVVEEGLEARWERHLSNQRALVAGLEAMGLELFVTDPAQRLVTVTSVKIPAGIDDRKVRMQLLDEFNIEIAGGFGEVKGKIWRVGLMGHSSRNTNVLMFLAAFEKVLTDHGKHVPAGAGVAAAIRSYQHNNQAAVVGVRK
jgi:alanine-glyoxylate transaminase / serine-glyoxylate transaminase / serine-pyruvate transaminase